MKNFGFFRVACVSPPLVVADCEKNADAIIQCVKDANSKNVSLIVFPELCISAYTCSDLFLQTALQTAAIAALEHIAEETKALSVLSVVGLPVAAGSALYNCAALVYKGKILALVPKTYIPNYSEFYERRHFAPAPKHGGSVYLSAKFPDVPFGTDIMICDAENPDLVIGAEICEDLWTPAPPSTALALSGATVIVNLSASNEIIGKADYRRTLVSSQSGRLASAYIYADAGQGESTTDLVFAGHNIIAENGAVLAESELFDGSLLSADIDLQRLVQERRKTNTFAQCAAQYSDNFKPRRINVEIQHENKISLPLLRKIDPHPFVPADKDARVKRCREVIALQSHGLAKRLLHTNAKTALIGLSGGLDSTLALLVTVNAFRICKRGLNDIIAVTMPCFGTTDRTHNNAASLAQALDVQFREINIEKAVRQHFSDIEQNEKDHDVTYENSQARERTQILMDLANKTGGLVIGTGDLSELALGWATYNGDHISMYGVNSSIPKTLVRYLVEWFADEAGKNNDEVIIGGKKTSAILRDILNTPVSPELLPPEDGKIVQKTEELVGHYELHDFFLYHLLRWGFQPEKILFLAEYAFNGVYTKDTILKWLKVFYKRFFSQQFKRSCMPDGAKVGTINLSPRGDWRMPSDASGDLWQQTFFNS